MIRKRTLSTMLGGALGLAALVFALLAGAAGAKPIKLDDVEVHLALGASHGYRISIEGSDDGRVDLQALSPDGAEAEYRVEGRVSGRRLRANFGRLGLVSVRFGGGSPVRRSRRLECGHETELLERGSFAGTIRFHGEEGFTSVSATGARGSVARSHAVLCSGGRAATAARAAVASDLAPKSLQTTVLGVGRRRLGRGTGLLFETSARPGESPDEQVAFASVRIADRRGRMEIERGAIFQAPASSLSVRGSGLSLSGSLSLPDPFEGEARFTATPEEEPMRWQGDLRVPLPGEAEVPLAGSGFRSVLCRGASRSSRFESCAEDANSVVFLSLAGEP